MASHLIFLTLLASVGFINCASIEKVTDKGEWDLKHELSIPFTIQDKHYFYSSYGKHWFIRELLEDGKMGSEKEKGLWPKFYTKAVVFTTDDNAGDGRHFLYLISNDNSWDVHEILPEGRIGNKTDFRFLDSQPSVIFSYKIEGKHYMYSQIGHDWSILELRSGGKVGSKTDSGTWQNIYNIGFPFTINNRQYFYCVSGKDWFIQELMPNGVMGEETDTDSWYNSHLLSFPFSVHGKTYFYGLVSKDTGFIQELLPNGKMGGEKISQAWPNYYSVSFAFKIKEKQFLYGLSDYYWKIWEIVI